MKKREAIKIMSTGTIGLGISGMVKAGDKPFQSSLNGNINHSACRWCYNGIELEVLCREAKKIGLVGIDIIAPDDWQTVFNEGLTVTMATAPGFSIPDGFNDPANHSKLQENYIDVIQKASDAGIKNVICFSGNTRELSEEQGLENCAVGLEPIVKAAERYNVLITMELLNSKVDHADYQCDNSPWGVSLCEKNRITQLQIAL